MHNSHKATVHIYDRLEEFGQFAIAVEISGATVIEYHYWKEPIVLDKEAWVIKNCLTDPPIWHQTTEEHIPAWVLAEKSCACKNLMLKSS